MGTNWNEIASELNYFRKNYAGLTKQIVQIRNRAHADGIDPDHDELFIGKHDKHGKKKTQGLESLKGVAARRIQKVINDFPVWDECPSLIRTLKGGPYYGANSKESKRQVPKNNRKVSKDSQKRQR